MLMVYYPLNRLLNGSRRLLLGTIILGRVPEFAVFEMDKLRDILKANLIVITPPKLISTNSVRGSNPRQECI